MPGGVANAAVALIPARLGSTRFPRKALASETGKPMVVHVREAAERAASIGRVVVATDAEEIAAVVRDRGGEAVMTSGAHPNGTSRLAEAATLLGLDDETVVVNVQGDEPEIDPALIDLAIAAHAASGAEVATIASPFGPGQSPLDPNIVKVVLDARGRALYFSRSPIPFDRDGACGVCPLKHVGLYVYRAGFLRRYVLMPETPLERAERLEQLRVLEHGCSIAVGVAEAHHIGIDTPAQYAAFVARWRNGTQ
ncbi:MAG: 3-deoxy-manno-octulosonate cytidylyltransferase [Phycisphaerales bacterium]|nr:3-deoxy-manno-octulosonate cytidylyltransferase [Phycisphaerales bacterium]